NGTGNPSTGSPPDDRYRLSATVSARRLQHGRVLWILCGGTATIRTGRHSRTNVFAHTRSANVVSVWRKYTKPPTRRRATATVDTASNGPGACDVPSSAQRKPSTTPAIGFRPRSARHFADTRVLGYATGVANSQNWVR